MRYPWVVITLALTTGIFAGKHFPTNTHYIPFLILTALLLALTLAIFKRLATAYLSLAISILLLGMWITTINIGFISKNHFSTLFHEHSLSDDQYLRIDAEIEDHPQWSKNRLTMIVNVRSVDLNDTFIPCSGRLRLLVQISHHWNMSKLHLHTGDEIRFLSQLKENKPRGNPAGFDFTEYLDLKEISHSSYLKSPLSITVIKRNYLHPGYYVSEVKGYLESILNNSFNFDGSLSRNGALMNALILGNRSWLESNEIEALKRNGLMHFLAISGFHIWVLSILVIFLLRFFGINTRAVYSSTIILICLYWLLSGMRPSATRAGIIAVVYLIGLITSQKVELPNVLAFAAFIILALDPLSLFTAGFQLTFIAAFSIVFIGPVFFQMFKPLGFPGSILAVSLSTQLGLLPIIAIHFNMIALHSVVTSLMLFFLVSALVFTGMLHLIILHFVPLSGSLSVSLQNFLSDFLFSFAGFVNNTMPFTLRGPVPGTAIVIIYYLLLLSALIIFYRISKYQQNKWKYISASLLVIMAVTLLAINPFVQPEKGQYRLHMFDVGSGESMLFQAPDGTAMLIDAGGTPFSDFDVGENIVSPNLWHRGIRALDVIVISHAHSDHAEGVLSILQNFPVGEIWIPGLLHRPPLEDEIRNLARKKSIPVKTLVAGAELNWKNTHWRILHPEPDNENDTDLLNDSSLVCEVTFDKHSILLMGDAESTAQQDMINSGQNLDAPVDVLKVPHHGHKDSINPQFQRQFKQQISIISTNKVPSDYRIYAESSDPHIWSERIFSTAKDGMISLTFFDSAMLGQTWLTRKSILFVRSETGNE